MFKEHKTSPHKWKSVYISDLCGASSHFLRNLLQKYGDLRALSMKKNVADAPYAFASFASADDALDAVAGGLGFWRGNTWHNINIQFAKTNDRGRCNKR
jgi:hypothetical protein